jgi:hypothetical protein
VISLAILGTIAGAFRIAGVGSVFIANLLLIAGVGLLIPIEVGCSKWIRKTGRYSWSIILIAVFISGTATVFLAQTIASLKQQGAVIPSPAPVPVPAPPIGIQAPPPPLGLALRVMRYETLPFGSVLRPTASASCCGRNYRTKNRWQFTLSIIGSKNFGGGNNRICSGRQRANT